MQAPNGVVTTIRFRDPVVRVPYQFAAAFPVQAREITVTGRAATGKSSRSLLVLAACAVLHERQGQRDGQEVSCAACGGHWASCGSAP